MQRWSSMMISTFLLLSFFSVGLAQTTGSAIDENDSYPPFWDHIRGDIAEFPVQNNKIIIDPWKYINRLQIFKILMKETNKYFASFGENGSGNVFWPWALFHGTLFESGRLSEPLNTSKCTYEAGLSSCISIKSGWGGISFYVLATYFLAAIESKFLRAIPYEIELIPQEEYRSKFCYSVAECRASYPRAMDRGNDFFKYLLSRVVVSSVGGIPKYNVDEDTVIRYMWDVHQAAVDVGKSQLNDVAFYSSETERDFFMDFLLAVEFCVATLYRPYINSTAEFLVGFPHRPLTDQDRNVLASDFTVREKAFMSSVKFFSRTNEATGGLFLTIWKIAMTSEAGRAAGRFLIKMLLLIPSL